MCLFPPPAFADGDGAPQEVRRLLRTAQGDERRRQRCGEARRLLYHPRRLPFRDTGWSSVGEARLVAFALPFEAHTPRCHGTQTEGQWYYEIEIIKGTGIGQLGWADLDFIGAARGGRGIGDDLHSWGWDGARVLMWSNKSYGWGAKWHVRD